MAKKHLSQVSLYCICNSYSKNINKTDSVRQNMHIKFPRASDKVDRYAETIELYMLWFNSWATVQKEKAEVLASDTWVVLSIDGRKDIFS